MAYQRYKIAGAWTPPKEVWSKRPLEWVKGKVLYHKDTYTDEKGATVTGWRNAGYLTPPPDVVQDAAYAYPGVKDSLTVDVSWTAYLSGDWRYDFLVGVSWYVNGAYFTKDQTQQQNGAISRSFTHGDSVYFVIYYENNVGTGPTTRLPASGSILIDDGGGGA